MKQGEREKKKKKKKVRWLGWVWVIRWGTKSAKRLKSYSYKWEEKRIVKQQNKADWKVLVIWILVIWILAIWIEETKKKQQKRPWRREIQMNQPSFYKLFSGTVVGCYGINVLGIAVEVSKKAS